jgi:hypothetical protein
MLATYGGSWQAEIAPDRLFVSERLEGFSGQMEATLAGGHFTQMSFAQMSLNQLLVPPSAFSQFMSSLYIKEYE